MPEGHVIHGLARRLNKEFGHTRPEVSSPQGRFAQEAQLLSHTEFVRAEAVGKHLFLHFEHERIVWIHLGLIGTMQFGNPEKGQVRLLIRNHSHDVALRGPQWCRLISPADLKEIVRIQGADPLAPDPARVQEVLAKVQHSKREVADVLMDQKLFAGVGNIYRAEVLFRLEINPFVPSNQLEQWPQIFTDLEDLMAVGVARGRIDTVRPEHEPQAMGREPRKDDHGGEVYVYRREGLPCYVCGTPIMKKEYKGRNLFWCPTCQSG